MSYIAKETRYGEMKYNRCGKSGLLLPQVSLGMWHNFGANDDYENMKSIAYAAFDGGITHFDLGNNYGLVAGSAEENMGRMLRDSFRPYRDELIISTKAGYTMWPGPYGDWGSRKSLLSSLDQSLGRMGLEYVDIFYHHRRDPATPMEESMMALDQAVKSGKALYAGISNYDRESTRQAVEIMRELKCPFVINQRRYSIFDRTIETEGLKEYCQEDGVGIIAFSPLAQGLLAGRYLNGIPQDSRMGSPKSPFLREERLTPQMSQSIAQLNQIAVERGESLAQMALKWVLKDQMVCSVLIGASSPQQIADNLGVINSPDFTEDQLVRIDQAQQSAGF